MKYLKHPRTVKELAEQIKVAIDDYWKMELKEEDLKALLISYVANHGDKIFTQKREFSGTMQQRLGKRRIELFNIMIQGHQYRI